MSFFIGIGLTIILILIDVGFFYLIKGSNINTTLLYINVGFFIGMVFSILYVGIIAHYLKSYVTFEFGLGLFISVIISTIFKIIKTKR